MRRGIGSASLKATNSTKLDSSTSSTCKKFMSLVLQETGLEKKKRENIESLLKLDRWSITKNLLEYDERRFKADKVGFPGSPCAVHIAGADRISIKTWSVVGTRVLSKKIRLKPDTAVAVSWLELHTLGTHVDGRLLDAWRVSACTGTCVSIPKPIVPFSSANFSIRL